MTSPRQFLTIVTLVLIIPLLSGCDPKCWPLCGSSSSGTTTEVVIKDCSGPNSCNGTYSSASSADAKWTGACVISTTSTESDGSFKINFNTPTANCGFASIKAEGDVVTKWRAYTKFESEHIDREFMVKYLGEDVFDLVCYMSGVVSECSED